MALKKHDVVNFFEIQLRYIRQGEVQLAPDRYGDLPIHRAVLDKAISVGTIKLMVASNPNVLRSLILGDRLRCILHVRLVILMLSNT